jgi:hypothetical protein
VAADFSTHTVFAAAVARMKIVATGMRRQPYFIVAT